MTATTLPAAERAEMLQVISDLSKDAYGYRVRLDYAAMSDAELSATWDRFMVDMKASQLEEEAAEQAALERLRARVAGLQADHGISQQDALRWLMQAEGAVYHDDAEYDQGYFLFLQGLSCGAAARAFCAEVGWAVRTY